MQTTWYDTIVIGGGQAGLAVGYHLTQRDVDFVILDAALRTGSTWRNRWDSLRLFTPARYSGLPGMPFPDAPMNFPDKDQVADYLERYAERFDLPIRFNTAVTSLRGGEGQFIVETTQGRFEANNVVVATGPSQRPRVPAMAQSLKPEIRQLHSSEYHNPLELPPGDVLVVGAGNSGAQIAIELSKLRTVTLAGRDLSRMPRRILGADLFHWIWPVMRRLTRDTWLGNRIQSRAITTTDPLIGISQADIKAHGVNRTGRVTDVREGLPVVDGVAMPVATVIWATGFAPDYRWLDLPVLGPNGAPRHTRGVSEVEGLYFVGQRYQYRQTSALIGGVGADAEFIAEQVARSVALTPTAVAATI